MTNSVHLVEGTSRWVSVPSQRRTQANCNLASFRERNPGRRSHQLVARRYLRTASVRKTTMIRIE